MNEPLLLTGIRYNRKKLEKFWKRVANAVMPDFDFQKDQGSIKWKGRQIKNWDLDRKIPGGMSACEELNRILSLFNPELNIDFNCVSFVAYEPGFVFYPHYDEGRKIYMAFPILPEDGGVPINFYDEIVMSQGDDVELHNKSIIHSHNYSTEYATLVDVTQLHGVVNDDRWRIYLQLDLGSKRNNITFDQCKKMIDDNTFYRKANK